MWLASVCSSSTTAGNAKGCGKARHVGDVEGGDDPYSDQQRDKGYYERRIAIKAMTGPSDGHGQR
jgi:hypothetical protein